MQIGIHQAANLARKLGHLSDRQHLGYSSPDLWLVASQCTEAEKSRFLALYYGAISKDTTPEKKKENCLEINKMAQRIIRRTTSQVTQ